METIFETIRRELDFLPACDGEQYERVMASLKSHIAML